eukprot:12475725-Ditylum_brightwellii.AAC.1
MGEDEKVGKEKISGGKTPVRGKSQNKTHFQQRNTRFKGRCDELKGHIFDCSDSYDKRKNSPQCQRKSSTTLENIISKAREATYKEAIYDQNLASVYQLIWGQGSDLMRKKIKANPNYSNFKKHY